MSNRIAIVPHAASIQIAAAGTPTNWISVADPSLYFSHSHTFGFWGNHELNTISVGGLSGIYGYGSFRELLQVLNYGGKLNQMYLVYVDTSGYQQLYFDTFATTVKVSEWSFYVVSMLETTGPNNVRSRCYVNGSLVGEYNRGFLRLDLVNPFIIGYSFGPWHGQISGAFFCNGELSQTEIMAIYRGRKRVEDATGIVSYWPMNEGVGVTTADVVGGNTGTFVGSTAWSTSVPQKARQVVVPGARQIVAPGTRQIVAPGTRVVV